MVHYVSDSSPGITRRRHGSGFSYRHPNGRRVGAGERQRIADLAIPPAWTDVWICPDPDGHILATGRDDRGRKQYRYHPDWEAAQHETKFERMAQFGEGLGDLRRRVASDLKRRTADQQQVVALVVRLLDDTLIRVGNRRYAVENDSYGLTTLQGDDVEVDGASVHFEFVGKGGAEWDVEVQDRRLANLVRRCHELGGQQLFTYESEDGLAEVTSSHVNDYLREVMGEEISAKDFRTWGGSSHATLELAARPVPDGVPGAARDEAVQRGTLEAIDATAEVLGNTREVCRTSYVHPGLLTAYASGQLGATWRATRSGVLSRAERTLLRVIEA